MDISYAILGLTAVGTLTGCAGLGYLIYGIVANPVPRNFQNDDIIALAEDSAAKILNILEKILKGEIEGPDYSNLIEVLVHRINEQNVKVTGHNNESENL